MFRRLGRPGLADLGQAFACFSQGVAKYCKIHCVCSCLQSELLQNPVCNQNANNMENTPYFAELDCCFKTAPKQPRNKPATCLQEDLQHNLHSRFLIAKPPPIGKSSEQLAKQNQANTPSEAIAINAQRHQLSDPGAIMDPQRLRAQKQEKGLLGPCSRQLHIL